MFSIRKANTPGEITLAETIGEVKLPVFSYSRHHFSNRRVRRSVETLMSQVLVVHTCNSSYTGSRDQEDHGLKPSWANGS
jgi:hypothetical protein